MDKCSLCECDLPKELVHLGYKECLECSDTEKYASHVVYPHKTGGYIQPMSSEQANDMKRLDRRSVGGGRKAKGIVADKSWDRWLENYYDNIYNKRPKKKISRKKFQNFSHMESKTLYHEIVKEFIQEGYHQAVNKVNELYSQDKISLIQKMFT